MIENLQVRPVLLPPGSGPALSFLGVELGFKVTSADTAGAWALLDYVAPPKFPGPPLHWHKVTNEIFYVLEGVVTFRMGDEVFEGQAGAVVSIPCGTLHTFSNPSGQAARFLTFLTPGGFEAYFKELAAMVQSEPVWPPEDKSKLLALYAKHDNYFPAGEGR